MIKRSSADACVTRLREMGVRSLETRDFAEFCNTALDTVLGMIPADSGLLYVRSRGSSELHLVTQRRGTEDATGARRRSHVMPLVSSNGEAVGLIASYSADPGPIIEPPLVEQDVLCVVADVLLLHDPRGRLHD